MGIQVDAGAEIGMVEFPDGTSEDEMQRALENELRRVEMTKNERTGRIADAAAGGIDLLENVVRGVSGEPIGRALKTAGEGVAAVAADVGGYVRRGEIPLIDRPLQMENTAAFMEGKPLPSDVRDEGILEETAGGFSPGVSALLEGEAVAETKGRARDQAALRLGARDAARSVPAVGAGLAMTAAGVPAPIAFGLPMEMQTAAETDDPVARAKSLAIGALIPGVAAAGKRAAGWGLSEAVKGGWLGAESQLGQKVVETIASQATVQSLIELSNLPQYLRMSEEERRSALVRSMAANMAFGLMDLPQFKAGVPSETQSRLIQDAGVMVGALLEKGPLLRMDPQELALMAADPRFAEFTIETTKVGMEGGDGLAADAAARGDSRPTSESPALSAKGRAGVWEASTPVAGQRVQGIWRVVDASELLTSADSGFDQALQPRDRSREASVQQIEGMARGLDPERLVDAPTTDLGAPVIDERNQVLSGNGRVSAIRKSYTESTEGEGESQRGEEYRNYIRMKAEELGVAADELDAIGKLNRPVLVRQVTELGGLSKEEFARQSNQQQVLGMGEAEKAAADAKVVERIMDLFRPSEEGDVMAATNRDFLKEFVKGSGDAAELLTKEGFNSGAMTRRVRNAVLGNLVGSDTRGRDLLSSLLERGDELGVKSAVTGVMNAAPGLMKASGDYDLRPVLSKAMRDLVKIRTEGLKVEDYTRQLDLLADPERSIESDFLLTQMAKAKGARPVTEALLKYAEQVKHESAKAGGDMFGEAPRNRSELIQDAFTAGKKSGTESTERGTQRAQSKRQGELVAATVEQATLPRNIESDTPAGTDELVSLAEIRQYLSTALDIPVRARRYGKRALGIFKVNPETIRLKAINDIPTLAHEVGHYLHGLLFPATGGTAGPRGLVTGAGQWASDFWGRFDAELNALGQVTSRPNYTADQVRQEGVAEFMREWLSSRADALMVAPNFLHYFEGALQTNYPEVWKILTRAQADLRRYIQQPVMTKVRSRIARRDPSRQWNWREFWNEQVTAWVNDLAPIERGLKQLEQFGLPAKQAQMVNDLAVNYIGGWRGKVEYALLQRQIDINGNDVGPSLREILGGIDDLTEFGDYLVAVRELELHGRGIKTGMDPQDAPMQVKALAALAPKYSKPAAALYAFQRNQVKLLVEAGILSPASFQKMTEMNRFYVPFYRMMEGIDGEKGSAPKAGKGLVDLQSGIYKIKGSDRQYVDPLESVIKNAYLFRDLAERNTVARHFMAAVAMVRGGGRVAEGITKKVKPVKIGGEEIEGRLLKEWEAQLNAKGIALPPADQMPDLTQMAFTLWRAAKQSSPREGIFTVWDGGKEKVFQVGDPELYRALTLADRTGGRMFQNIFMKALRAPARVLRTGATHTLEFMARNPLRDQFAAGIYSKHGYVPLFDGVRGMFSAIGRDKLYWDWVKAGGKYSEMVATDREGLQAQLKDLNPTVRQQVLRLMNPMNIVKHLQTISMVMEQATRLSEYRRAIANGATPIEAANASKDVTLNFARGGTHGKFLNQLVAFFNAGVQDVSKFTRAHKERPLETAMKGFMYITAPTLLAWWLGKDDEKIQGLPTWRKMMFWNVNVGKMVGGEDLVLSFPKPIGLLGWIYANGPEAALDYAMDKDPNAVKKWFNGMLESSPVLSPLLAMTGNWQKAVEPFIPTAAVPVVEGLGNRSLFRDAPIESEAMKRLPPYLRYEPQTSFVARKLGEIAPWEGGASPVMIDNTLRRYLGGLGKYGTDATEWLLLKSNAVDLPAPAEKGIWERPLLRAFAGSPYEATQYVTRFYDGVERADQRVAELKALATLDEDKARTFLQKNKAALFWYEFNAGGETMLKRVHQTRDQLSDVLKAMREVQTSKTMSPEAKRSSLMQLSAVRNQLARQAYETFLAPADRKKVF